MNNYQHMPRPYPKCPFEVSGEKARYERRDRNIVNNNATIEAFNKQSPTLPVGSVWYRGVIYGPKGSANASDLVEFDCAATNDAVQAFKDKYSKVEGV